MTSGGPHTWRKILRGIGKSHQNQNQHQCHQHHAPQKEDARRLLAKTPSLRDHQRRVPAWHGVKVQRKNQLSACNIQIQLASQAQRQSATRRRFQRTYTWAKGALSINSSVRSITVPAIILHAFSVQAVAEELAETLNFLMNFFNEFFNEFFDFF